MRQGGSTVQSFVGLLSIGDKLSALPWFPGVRRPWPGFSSRFAACREHVVNGVWALYAPIPPGILGKAMR